MNEGLMIHPMHLHGMPHVVVAKDGYPLPRPTVRHAQHRARRALGRDRRAGQARDLGVPLPHPLPRRAPNGMFGMVTALIVDVSRCRLSAT